jgi:hypothetical protein
MSSSLGTSIFIGATEKEYWFRKGRGRTLQFYVTDNEISTILTDRILKDFAPYSIIGMTMYQVAPNDFRERLEEVHISELISLTSRSLWQFFIKSQVLSEYLYLGTADLGLMSLNGLINLQHGWKRRGMVQTSSLGIVDQIIDSRTGGVLIHSNYLLVYKSLVSAVKKILRFRVKEVWRDGSQHISKYPVMSQDVADLWLNGEMQLPVTPIMD